MQIAASVGNPVLEVEVIAQEKSSSLRDLHGLRVSDHDHDCNLGDVGTLRYYPHPQHPILKSECRSAVRKDRRTRSEPNVKAMPLDTQPSG